jgi:hypothetical protein
MSFQQYNSACHWKTVSQKVCLEHLAMDKLITLVVLDTDFIDSCKSYYHTITTTMTTNKTESLGEWMLRYNTTVKFWTHFQ